MRYLVLILLISLAFFASCWKDDPTPIPSICLNLNGEQFQKGDTLVMTNCSDRELLVYMFPAGQRPQVLTGGTRLFPDSPSVRKVLIETGLIELLTHTVPVENEEKIQEKTFLITVNP